MDYHLAQLNIARFRLPPEHPNNADFVNNLDRINAIAEQQPGYIWRLKGDGNDALDIKAFEDPNLVINLSLWSDMESLSAFVYRNKEHRQIMRRRAEWFEKVEFHLCLWWLRQGELPQINDAINRLAWLQSKGPSPRAFTFKSGFAKPKD